MFLITYLAALCRAPKVLHVRQQCLGILWKAVRLCVLGLVLLLFLVWWHPAFARLGAFWQIPGSVISTFQSAQSSQGKGAGGFGDNRRDAQNLQEPASCAPFDASCLANSVALSIAQGFITALQPITDGILSDPADIVIQTPPLDSYQDPSVTALNGLFVETVDAALALLLLIGGYTVMVGPAFQVQSPLSELLPRAILVGIAVQINLTFLGTCIDLANKLSLLVYHEAQVQSFANLLASFLSFD
ncbi:MAG: hypothetical protein ACRDHZ_09325, partial [Ktedonobacteraceae bacterium]